jgi:hypothetical protein
VSTRAHNFDGIDGRGLLYNRRVAEVTMRRWIALTLACGVMTLVTLRGTPLQAQTFVGTWVRQDTPMTMTVEVCCGNGRRLTYRVAMNGTEMIMVVESALDGTDARCSSAASRAARRWPSGRSTIGTRRRS